MRYVCPSVCLSVLSLLVENKKSGGGDGGEGAEEGGSIFKYSLYVPLSPQRNTVRQYPLFLAALPPQSDPSNQTRSKSKRWPVITQLHCKNKTLPQPANSPPPTANLLQILLFHTYLPPFAPITITSRSLPHRPVTLLTNHDPHHFLFKETL
jgi:hypothetical protein